MGYLSSRQRVSGLRDISFPDSPCKVYKSLEDLKKGIVSEVIYAKPATGTIVLGNKHKRKNKNVNAN